MSQDYYATLKVQQGRLMSAMQRLNINSARALSVRAGVSYQCVLALLNFRLSPRTKSGEWRKPVLKLSRELASDPSDLFPEHLDYEVSTNKIEDYVERAQLEGSLTQGLSPPGFMQFFDHDEAMDALGDAMDSLDDRERLVLTRTFCEKKTIRDVAKELDLCAPRVGQIRANAIRKMRKTPAIRALIEWRGRAVYVRGGSDERL